MTYNKCLLLVTEANSCGVVHVCRMSWLKAKCGGQRQTAQTDEHLEAVCGFHH